MPIQRKILDLLRQLLGEDRYRNLINSVGGEHELWQSLINSAGKKNELDENIKTNNSKELMDSFLVILFILIAGIILFYILFEAGVFVAGITGSFFKWLFGHFL